MQQQQAQIIFDDVNQSCLYLNNRVIIDRNAFYRNQQIVQLGLLIPTNDPNKYLITNNQGNNVKGEFIQGRGPVYYQQANTNNVNSTSNITTESMNLAMGGQSNAANSCLSGVETGSIYFGGDTTQTADVSNAMNIQVPSSIQKQTPMEATKNLIPLEKHWFRPIPTSYSTSSKVVTGEYYKWKIEIKEDDMSGDKHSDIYNKLNREVSGGGLIKVNYEESDDALDLSSGNAMLVAKASVINHKEAKTTLLIGQHNYGYLHSVADIKPNEFDSIVVGEKLKESKVIVVNRLTDLADTLKSMNITENPEIQHPLISWVATIKEMIPDELDRFTLNKLLQDLLKENLSTIDNQIKVHSSTNVFQHIKELVEYIYATKDIEVRGKYIIGLNKVYKRLTDKNNLTTYIAPASYPSIKNKMLTVSGFCEEFLVVSTKDANITLELSKMINTSSEETYRIYDNTPNLLKLVKGIFVEGVIISETNSTKTIKNICSNKESFILVLKDYSLKVVKSDDIYTLYKI